MSLHSLARAAEVEAHPETKSLAKKVWTDADSDAEVARSMIKGCPGHQAINYCHQFQDAFIPQETRLGQYQQWTLSLGYIGSLQESCLTGSFSFIRYWRDMRS